LQAPAVIKCMYSLVTNAAQAAVVFVTRQVKTMNGWQHVVQRWEWLHRSVCRV